jgi:cytochrome c peroxidase
MEKDRRTSKLRGYHLFISIVAIIFVITTMLGYAGAKSKSSSDEDYELTDIEKLGKYVFYDKISSPQRMACVTCHDPATGGTGSISGVNLHQVAITGANPHTVGNIKPPTNAYATFIEPFHDCNTGGLGPNNKCGGNFWNGRAEGNVTAMYPDGATKHIGEEIFYTTDGTSLDASVLEYDVYFGPVADQALNPMPNPVEHNSNRLAVCEHVKSSKYAELYEHVWGVPIDCSDEVPVTEYAVDVDEEYPFDISFKRLALAMAAYQGSLDVNSFSSKRDKTLRAELACACREGGEVYPGDEICDEVADSYDSSVCMQDNYRYSPGDFPLVGMTDEENLGHDLFYGITSALNPEGKNANCGACHSDNPPAPGPPGSPPSGGDTGVELFQQYSADDYHNIATPPNPEIPVTYNSANEPIDPDLGIAGHIGDIVGPGFFKTPTLRNVDKRKGEGFIKAYTHNGWFKSLESIVHFYNTAFLGGPLFPFPGAPVIDYEDTTAFTFGVTRCPSDITSEKDALANNCWPEAAYPGAPMPFLLGDLKLTAEEEAAIVAYLKTLTDEHTAKQPKPYKPQK